MGRHFAEPSPKAGVSRGDRLPVEINPQGPKRVREELRELEARGGYEFVGVEPLPVPKLDVDVFAQAGRVDLRCGPWQSIGACGVGNGSLLELAVLAIAAN